MHIRQLRLFSNESQKSPYKGKCQDTLDMSHRCHPFSVLKGLNPYELSVRLRQKNDAAKLETLVLSISTVI